VDDARVVLMGVHEVAVRATSAEAVMRGRVATEDVIAEAASAVDGHIDPVSDLHASTEYRRYLAQVLTRRALRTARDRSGVPQ
jgi:CO/xanthine dehydrogenase FAD-binding subunit